MAVAPLTPSLTVISEMITPALLIVASGSLVATALARLARVVDRTRAIRLILEKLPADDMAPRKRLDQELDILESRSHSSERAVTTYYLAICAFVLTCLLIALGHLLSDYFGVASVGTALVGVFLQFAGSWSMVAECRLASKQVKLEMAGAREHLPGF